MPNEYKNYKLTIELVPETSFYNNVRSIVTEEGWDLIRRFCYKRANYKCEICGDDGINQGIDHPVECHEIWQYDDTNHTQTLIGLISLCPYCHKTKHAGLAQINGETDIVTNQLMKVNNITLEESLNYFDYSFDIWRKRSEYQWKVNIDYVKKYLKQ